MQDKIEKTLTLKAPQARVWEALTNHTQFGEWFKVQFDGPFVEGKALNGKITYPGYEHMEMQVIPRKIQPQSYFSYTWCPYSDNKPEGKDRETLVEFKLKTLDEGTHLTIIESGFAALPADARREEAFRMNTNGWNEQAKNIAAYVES